MALMITKDANTGERTRTLGVDRSKAVEAVVGARKGVPPIEKSGQAPEPVAPDAGQAPEPAAPPEAPASPPAADPGHALELERRERALDAARHEHEQLKREYERLKSSPEEALRAAGYDPDRYIARYLGEEKPAGGEAPKAEDPASALQKRVEAMEAERDQERQAARARARRQEIEAMIPDSEEFDALHGLKDFGAMDQLMHALGEKERAERRSLGPNEIKALLGDFEGASRKNVSTQISRLAERKWFRTMVTELLEKSGKTAPASSTDAPETSQPPPNYEAPAPYERRSMSLSGREREVLRERVKRAALQRRGS